MTRAINNPLNGSVVLRGIKIDLDTDIGNGFVIDCTRHVEELVSAEQLKAKYQLTEEAWRQLADNEPLQQAVERAKELSRSSSPATTPIPRRCWRSSRQTNKGMVEMANHERPV